MWWMEFGTVVFCIAVHGKKDKGGTEGNLTQNRQVSKQKLKKVTSRTRRRAATLFCDYHFLTRFVFPFVFREFSSSPVISFSGF